MNKSFLVLLALVLLLGVGLGGAFVGGVAYGKTQQEASPDSPRVLGGGSNPLGGGGNTGFGAGQNQPQSRQRSEARRSGSDAGPGSGVDGGFNRTDSASAADPGAGPRGFGSSGGPRSGMVGTIISREQGLLIIETPQGEAQRVNLAEAVTIQKFAEGSREDLTEGAQVRIVGQPDAEGNIQAQTIVITPEGAGFPQSGGASRGERSQRGGETP